VIYTGCCVIYNSCLNHRSPVHPARQAKPPSKPQGFRPWSQLPPYGPNSSKLAKASGFWTCSTPQISFPTIAHAIPLSVIAIPQNELLPTPILTRPNHQKGVAIHPPNDAFRRPAHRCTHGCRIR
jgi:hypothetical protein